MCSYECAEASRCEISNGGSHRDSRSVNLLRGKILVEISGVGTIRTGVTFECVPISAQSHLDTKSVMVVVTGTPEVKISYLVKLVKFYQILPTLPASLNACNFTNIWTFSKILPANESCGFFVPFSFKITRVTASQVMSNWGLVTLAKKCWKTTSENGQNLK